MGSLRTLMSFLNIRACTLLFQVVLTYTVPCKSIQPPWLFTYFVTLQPLIQRFFLFELHVIDQKTIV